MKTLLLLLLLFILVPIKSFAARHKQLPTVVVNAFPVGLGILDNVKSSYGSPFSNAASASVYWVMNKVSCWYSGIDTYVVSGRDAQGQEASAIGLISVHHGIMFRANGRDVTRKGFYLMLGLNVAYVPDVDIKNLEDKGGLLAGPTLSVGVETGKINDHLGFIFEIFNISPIFHLIEGKTSDRFSSSQFLIGSMFRVGVNYAL